MLILAAIFCCFAGAAYARGAKPNQSEPGPGADRQDFSAAPSTAEQKVIDSGKLTELEIRLNRSKTIFFFLCVCIYCIYLTLGAWHP